MADETVNYTGDNIKTLEWNEHIRKRAGMYIGRLGNGDNPGDGIYVLLKEVIDNSIDEFTMGYGKTISITIDGKDVTVRDFGRGIPLDEVVDVVRAGHGHLLAGRAFGPANDPIPFWEAAGV